jgi:hypothetical protein
MIRDLLSTPVPAGLAHEHLNLLTSFEAILTDIRTMEQSFVDPLYTLARMKRYQDDVNGILYTFKAIEEKLTRSGIVFTETETGSVIYFFTNI